MRSSDPCGVLRGKEREIQNRQQQLRDAFYSTEHTLLITSVDRENEKNPDFFIYNPLQCKHHPTDPGTEPVHLELWGSAGFAAQIPRNPNTQLSISEEMRASCAKGRQGGTSCTEIRGNTAETLKTCTSAGLKPCQQHPGKSRN